MSGYSSVYPRSLLMCVSLIGKVYEDGLQQCIPRVIITVCILGTYGIMNDGLLQCIPRVIITLCVSWVHKV